MIPAELQAIRELNDTMRGLAAILAANARELRNGSKQFFSLDDLERRYELSRGQVAALWTRHFGYQPRRGVSPRFPLEEVLRMDDILRGQ